MSAETGPVTEILASLRAGRAGAEEELFQAVYAELRRLAQSQMNHQGPGHTLQPTALVHEAYLRLAGNEDAGWNDRAHFLAAAARAMRSILVDHYRRGSAARRGGGRERVPLHTDIQEAPGPDIDLVALNEALERLEEASPERSRIVELRYFAGLTNEEAAKVLGVDERTAYRMWEFSRTWLSREMSA
jgi:RNA polymerase sigma-70 factor (ECF subfamily)